MASVSVRDAEPDAASPPGDGAAPDDGPTHRRWSGAIVVLALAALVVLPLVVGLVGQRHPRWVPVLDLAQTELRVRDVGTRHTPLIGLPGRIGNSDHQGSHPGPLSFYALAPVYRLLGSSAWALQASMVVIQAGAVLTAIAIARRRGGTELAAGLALVLAVLATGYGAATLTVPWNPFLPVLWWVVVMLATWAVVGGDVAMLPVVVVAGSFCAQTHVPYVGLCVGMGAVAAAAAVAHARRADRPGRRVALRWSALALGLGLLCWTPPLIDQVIHTPGNLTVLKDHFTASNPGTVGVTLGARLVEQRVDVVNMVEDQLASPGHLVVAPTDGRVAHQGRGLVAIAVWLASVVVAVRLRHRALIRLHTVVAIGLVLAVLIVSRIFGTIWYYLMLWIWGVAALMLVAVGWTVAATIGRRIDADARRRWAAGALAVLVTMTAVVSVRFSVSAYDARPPDDALSQILGRLVPSTVAALHHGDTYVVAWSDAAHLGSQGFGLLNELERRGFRVGVLGGLGPTATFHRVMDPSRADARVTLATGIWVDRWRAVPGARQVAYVDPRSPVQRAEYERVRAAVIADLERAGLDDLVAGVDDNLFGTAIDPRLPLKAEQGMTRLLELGVPTAVFVGPPTAEP